MGNTVEQWVYDFTDGSGRRGSRAHPEKQILWPCDVHPLRRRSGGVHREPGGAELPEYSNCDQRGQDADSADRPAAPNQDVGSNIFITQKIPEYGGHGRVS